MEKTTSLVIKRNINRQMNLRKGDFCDLGNTFDRISGYTGVVVDLKEGVPSVRYFQRT